MASSLRAGFRRPRGGTVSACNYHHSHTEILTGPLRSGDEALARRYLSALQSWQRVDLDLDIAESAARFRASLRLKLSDAVQVASALKINAAALVTHDRDFLVSKR